MTPYGEVLSLRLNSRARSVSLVEMLKGEEDALEVGIRDYAVVVEDGQYYFLANGMVATRECLNALAREHVAAKACRFQAILPRSYRLPRRLPLEACFATASLCLAESARLSCRRPWDLVLFAF